MPLELIARDRRCTGAGVPARETPVRREFVDPNNLEHRIVRFLQAHGLGSVEGFDIDVSGGTVVLRGHLPNRDAKRLCLECCRHVAGVVHLVDEVEIDPSTN